MVRAPLFGCVQGAPCAYPCFWEPRSSHGDGFLASTRTCSIPVGPLCSAGESWLGCFAFTLGFSGWPHSVLADPGVYFQPHSLCPSFQHRQLLPGPASLGCSLPRPAIGLPGQDYPPFFFNVRSRAMPVCAQVRHFHRHHQVIRQCRNQVVGLVGPQRRSRQMMQFQPAEHFG